MFTRQVTNLETDRQNVINFAYGQLVEARAIVESGSEYAKAHVDCILSSASDAIEKFLAESRRS